MFSESAFTSFLFYHTIQSTTPMLLLFSTEQTDSIEVPCLLKFPSLSPFRDSQSYLLLAASWITKYPSADSFRAAIYECFQKPQRVSSQALHIWILILSSSIWAHFGIFYLLPTLDPSVQSTLQYAPFVCSFLSQTLAAHLTHLECSLCITYQLCVSAYFLALIIYLAAPSHLFIFSILGIHSRAAPCVLKPHLILAATI